MSHLNVGSIQGNSPNFRVTLEDGSVLQVNSDFDLVNQQGFPIPNGTTAGRNASAKDGSLRFNTVSGQLEVYYTIEEGTGQWCTVGTNTAGYIAPGNTGGAGGGGGGADGSSASSAAPNLAGLTATTDGVYWFDNGGGPYQTYAKLESPIDTDPWVLAFNLNTNNTSDHDGGVPDWYNTTFWQSENEKNHTNTSPWNASYKSKAFSQYPVKEILFMTHKQGGFENNSSDLQGFGVYVNNAYEDDTLQNMFANRGENYYVSNSGRKTWQDYNPGYLNHNNNRPQVRCGDLFHTGNCNGYNNQDDRLMFNVTNNWCSNNQARARITTAAGQNCTYGYTSGGIGVAHRHNSWGMYAAYDKVSAYCGGTEIYGTSSNGNNYTSESGGSYGPSCMGRYNGTVNYNMAVWVR